MERRRGLGLASLVLVGSSVAVALNQQAERTETPPSLAALRASAALDACPSGLGLALRLDLPCLDGSSVTVDASPRRPVVLNAWAWWCQPCQKEMPLFVDLAARAAGRIDVVGVASDPDEQLALSFVRDFRVHYPNVLDADGRIFRKFAGGVPQTLFIRGDGTLAHVERGVIDSQTELDGLVADHLGVAVAPSK